MRTFLALTSSAVLAGALIAGAGPAHAQHVRGSVYSSEPYHFSYKYTDKGCKNLPFKVEGHAKGHETIYNVPGSDGQAFLDDNRNRHREVWTNPANGRQAYVSGKSRYREVEATHVKGDIWRFRSFTSGEPMVVKNDRGRVVLAEWGVIEIDSTFDTLGDGKPGGDDLKDQVVSSRGNWPEFDPHFDFCHLVERVLG